MRTKLVIAAVATAAAVSAVGASAYTNSLTGANNRYIGYASTSITGASFHAQPTFTYSADGTTITGIQVKLDGDTSVSSLYVRHDTVSSGTGTAEVCGAGTAAGSPSVTTYSCTVSWSVADTNGIAYSLQ